MAAPVWTDQAVAAAIKYNELGFSRSQIAGLIASDCGQRFTRNAVIGKLARLGAPSPKKPAAPSLGRARRPRRPSFSFEAIPKAKVAPRAVAVVRTPPMPVADMHVSALMTGAPIPLLIPYADQGFDECRFICTADGQPRAICGHPQAVLHNAKGDASRSSYCLFHHIRTHAAPSNAPRRMRPRV